MVSSVEYCDFRKDLPNFITFFKGPCKTRNLFSMMDKKS